MGTDIDVGGTVNLVDPRTGAHLCTLLPLDKQQNADGHRRVIVSQNAEEPLDSDLLPPSGIAPHLRALMQEYAATGLPPAYLIKLDTLIDHSPVIAEPSTSEPVKEDDQ